MRGGRLSLEPRDPGLDNLEFARSWAASLPRPWAVDLFCGAGGLSLGLEEAGLNVVAGADSDELALETHSAGVGGLSWHGDLGEPEQFLKFLADRGVDQVDVVAGGPPCQPFSRAGRAKIRSLVASGARPAVDPRVRAWRSYSEIVRALDPQVVLLENVPDLARWEDGMVLSDIQEMLRELGYEPHTRILLGEEYGVPQHRMRLFIVALKEGQFAWPHRRGRVNLKEAIGDLPRIPAGRSIDRISYGGPESRFQKRARRGVPKGDSATVFDHVSRGVRDDDREAFRHLPPGGTYASLPARLQRYRSDIFTDKYKRLSWKSVARTITAHIAKDGYWYVHPSQGRTLSIREAARIQTFPDWFRFAGHRTSQLRQIGNAVPPALARAVGLRVVAALETDGPPDTSKIGELLVEWNAEGETTTSASDPGARAWEMLLRATVFGMRDRSAGNRRESALLKAASSPKAVLNGGWRETDDLLRSMGREDRAEIVRELAETLQAKHAWSVPSSESDLNQLPGVSQAAAAWIASVAFGRRAITLDAPTRRVAERLSRRVLSSDWQARLEILSAAGTVGPTPEFGAAIRKLGREICVPNRPRCGECPLSGHCVTGGLG